MKKCYLSVTDKSICEKSGAAKNQYLYNGKELNTDFGLDWLDFGFRWYDPAICRFTGVDPISDEFPHVTTYNYAENEPIANIDLWGLQKFSITHLQPGLTTNQANGVQKKMEQNSKITKEEFINTVLDETPVVGEVKAFAEGGMVEVAAGLLPFGRKAKKAAQLIKNKKAGKKFEKQVVDGLDGIKAEQVTLEAADGTRTKMDAISIDKGKIKLTEAKASKTASLTKNQKSAHPQIEVTGATVKGKKGEAIGLPAGTKIPPTKVDVVRPKN